MTGNFRGLRLAMTVFVALLLSPGQLLASNSPAETVVAKATDEMLSLIDQAKTYVDEDRERFFTEVEQLLEPVIDFQRFARSVMAAYYRDATPAQRSRFEQSFKRTLVRTYSVALTEFEDGKVVIVPSDRPPQDPNRANVKQEIRLSSGEVYPVIYSMFRSEDGTWRMRNIIVNGVNMGLTYRNQFSSAATDARYGGDMDKVIDGWIESVGQEAEAENPEGEAKPEPVAEVSVD